ncbi:MAG TPA: T9SS type A sorting domain-containing protein [Flavipsychrobacter sp.]|nr:T9SS type A sorting domain-containing protein [Flavipsychrobacter sp.]
MLSNENGDSMLFNQTPPLSFYPLTDTVLYDASYLVSGPVDTGEWVGLALQKPFYYNGIKNFIIEIHIDSIDVPSGLRTASVITFSRNYSRVKNPSGTWNSIEIANGNPYIGFDILPNDVNDVQHVSSVLLYPNPASDKVSLQWDAGKSVKELSVTLTHVTGAVVWQHTYANAGTRFSARIDVSRLPRGLYLAEIKADGEKITRKLVLQ